MTTIRTLARAAFAAVCTMTAATAAEMPKAVPPTKQLVNRPAQPSAVVSPRDAASGQATGKRQHKPLVTEVQLPAAKAGVGQAVRPAGGGSGASAQKVTDGWGLAKGIGNIVAGAGKVVTGKVDAGLDQVKHGGEQVKASTDKDPANDPSKQPKGENPGK